MKIILITIIVFAFREFSSRPSSSKSLTAFEMKTKGIFENVIQKLLKPFLDVLTNFDPIDLGNLEYKIEGQSFIIKNAHLKGFSKFSIGKITFPDYRNDLILQLQLEMPQVSGLIENWNTDGDFMQGNGTAEIQLDNVQLNANAEIDLFPPKVKLIKIKPFVEQTDVRLTGKIIIDVSTKEGNEWYSFALSSFINNNQLFENTFNWIIDNYFDF